jgi:hypothetical protein
MHECDARSTGIGGGALPGREYQSWFLLRLPPGERKASGRPTKLLVSLRSLLHLLLDLIGLLLLGL